MIQKLHEAAHGPGGYHSFPCPSLLHIYQELCSHLLAQSGRFDAFLAKTTIESKTALHAFERGLSFKPRHLAQEGRDQSSVCVVFFHDFRLVPRTCLIESCLDIHARQVHSGTYQTAMFQYGTFFFLPLPEFLYQICRHHLQVLATDPIESFHVQFLPIFWVPSLAPGEVLHDANHFDNTNVKVMTL